MSLKKSCINNTLRDFNMTLRFPQKLHSEYHDKYQQTEHFNLQCHYKIVIIMGFVF